MIGIDMFFFKRKAKQQKSTETKAEIESQEHNAKVEFSVNHPEFESESKVEIETEVEAMPEVEAETDTSESDAISESFFGAETELEDCKSSLSESLKPESVIAQELEVTDLAENHEKVEDSEKTEIRDSDAESIAEDLGQDFDQIKADESGEEDFLENNKSVNEEEITLDTDNALTDTGALENTAQFNPFADDPETELGFVWAEEDENNLTSLPAAAVEDSEANRVSETSSEKAQNEDKTEVTQTSEKRKRIWLIGPNSYISFFVTICWVCLAIFAAKMMYGTAGIAVLVISVIAAVLTLVIGLSLIVLVNEKGVKPLFRTAIPWENIIEIHLESIIGWGKMNTPTLSYSKGRSIREIELEGLASIGSAKGAEKRAWKIADFGEIDFIVHEKLPSQAPRRSA